MKQLWRTQRKQQTQSCDKSLAGAYEETSHSILSHCQRSLNSKRDSSEYLTNGERQKHGLFTNADYKCNE